METESSNYFKTVAKDWDALRTGYFQENVREVAFSKAYLTPDMIVADIGAGTGFISQGLAEKVAKIHLLDASEEMLDVARQNLKEYTHVEYHLAESLDLPLADQSMDVVFANMYLHHTADPLAAIKEMVRLLKPGGRLVITDLDTHTNEWMRNEMADTWLGFDRQQMCDWFQSAGLVNVFTDCTGEDCSAESGEDKQQEAKISVFVAVGTRMIRMKEAVKSAYSLVAETGSESKAGDKVHYEFVSSGSCCEPSENMAKCCSGTSDSKIGYSSSDLQFVPAEAGEISLGCGNPLVFSNLKPGETVLDIGSGGGIDVFLSANRVGKDGHVIGVDMTPAMLARARASAQKNGYDQVEFRQGEAENLPVEDASVDVVISNCVINLTEDKGKAFRETYRVLKTGGRLEISDIVSGGNMPESLRKNQGEWAACVSGALPEQEYTDLIRAAGFTDLKVTRSDAYEIAGVAKVYSAIVSARKIE